VSPAGTSTQLTEAIIAEAVFTHGIGPPSPWGTAPTPGSSNNGIWAELPGSLHQPQPHLTNSGYLGEPQQPFKEKKLCKGTKATCDDS
jgi:hypothetical protein